MPLPSEVVSHWNILIENMRMSPQEFYRMVAASIERRKIPNARIDSVLWHESHLLSAKREYMRVYFNNDFYFAVCAAPFGSGFFVSSWLLTPPEGCLAALFSGFPLLSGIARAMVKPWTCYRMDSAAMFQTATHSAVTEVIDAITSAQGIKGLTEIERGKPVMQKFFQK